MSPLLHGNRLAMVVLYATVSLAVPSKASDLLSLSLDELLQVKIAGASLSEKTLSTTPASVSLFTGQEIENLGARTLEELISYAPGYQASARGDAPQQSAYSSRGRAIGTSSREVIVLVDGRRIEDNLSGGQSGIVPSLSLANVSTVEFIRGPASSLYGSNAFLGVINITSRQKVNALKVEAGSHGNRTAQLNLYQELAPKLSFDLHARRTESDGQPLELINKFTGDTTTTKAPYQNTDLDLRLSHSDTTLSLRYNKRASNGGLILGNLSEKLNSHESSNAEIALIHSFQLPEFQRFNLSAGASRRHYNITSQLTPYGAFTPISLPSSSAPLIMLAELEVEEPWVKLDGQYNASPNSDIVFGLEYRNVHFQHSDMSSNYDLAAFSSGQFPITYYGDDLKTSQALTQTHETIYGAYLQYEQHLESDATLSLGLRFDDYSLADNNLSPRITYVQPLLESSFIKLIWGESYRTPSFSERFTAPIFFQVGNPGIAPETVQTSEIVVGTEWNKGYSSVSLFHNTFEDSIAQTIQQGVRTFANTAQAEGYGLEAEAILELAPDWNLKASASHFLKSPEQSFRESSTFGSIALNRSSDHWNFNLNATYQAGQETPTSDPLVTQSLPSNWLAHFKASYRPSEPHKISFSARNLFDKEYRTASQSYIVGGAPNPGRTILIDYQFTW